MVFGVFAAMIAISGAMKENIGVSLIGLLLAVAGVVYHARLVVDAAKCGSNNKDAERPGTGIG